MADEEGSHDGAAVGVDEVLSEYLLVDPVGDFVFIPPYSEACITRQSFVRTFLLSFENHS